ncbi:nitrous oxide reductase family maturation protein NosD [Leifsonia sp. NPDC058248]|uniref:right-handed parallel beta-helix repeat-containing protein n=1 Tax=Leifsonia sp. NPDC058248 TaxID=3346402 RepID=UPI0036DDA1A6
MPEDAGSISAAVGEVRPGGMVLVGKGTYRESVTIDKPDVTIRGTDRNATVIDGEGIRPYGIVGVAAGVRVQNLTVKSNTFYGVLVTGLHDKNGPAAHGLDGYKPFDPKKFPPLQRYAIDHVTAYNNGLYGIYAFNSQHGSITESYASGSADSGFYVGQCRSCDVLVANNTAERNAIGFENANASDSVTIAGNRFTNNRVGITLISSYQEAFVPQRANTVIGNLIADNAEADSPAHAEGAFGIGIGIAGGRDNLFRANRVSGNPGGGVVLSNTEDLPATGNTFADLYEHNSFDVVNESAARAGASGNCFDMPGPQTSLPATSPEHPWYRNPDCSQTPQPATTPSATLSAVPTPPGISFLKVASPRPQPGLADVRTLPGKVPGSPDRSAVDTLTTPGRDYLESRSGIHR